MDHLQGCQRVLRSGVYAVVEWFADHPEGVLKGQVFLFT